MGSRKVTESQELCNRKNPREYLEQSRFIGKPSSKGCDFDAKDRFRPRADIRRVKWDGLL
jgi:hypothetical protein